MLFSVLQISFMSFVIAVSMAAGIQTSKVWAFEFDSMLVLFSHVEIPLTRPLLYRSEGEGDLYASRQPAAEVRSREKREAMPQLKDCM